jgi:multiple sugar transport system permease protein
MHDTNTALPAGRHIVRSTGHASDAHQWRRALGDARLLLLPGLLFTIVIIGYPALDLAWLSIHSVSRFGKILSINGFANYYAVFADPLFVASLWKTLIWTVAVVFGTMIISVPVALILNDDFFFRGAARTIIMLPWSVSLTMTAVVWRWALNGRAGLLNATLLQLGMISEPIEWLGQAHLAFAIEIIIGILVSIPFTTTILVGGLSSMPRDIYEAAAVDGARWTDLFRFMTVPLLKPFLNIAAVLNIIYVFNSFPIIWVMTEGGPANQTDILVTYLYKLAFRFGQLGKAAAISILMLSILLVFTLFYAWLLIREKQPSGNEVR